MIDRYEPIDWYKDGRPKAYRDNETGEEVSLHEYRKRRKAATSVDEGDDDEPNDDYETQAYADPAPRPRLFDVSAARDADEPQKPGVRRMGLTEMLAPAMAGFATSVALIRLRDSPRAVFVPPKEVTTPIIAPLGRIVDRHLPAELTFLMGEDGKDVTACLTAMGAGLVWFRDAVEEYERYRRQEREYYEQQRAYNGRTGNTTQASADSARYGADDLFQRSRERNGASLGYDATVGNANGAGISEISGDEAASRVRDLLRADAEGAMRRGLVDQ